MSGRSERHAGAHAAVHLLMSGISAGNALHHARAEHAAAQVVVEGAEHVLEEAAIVDGASKLTH